MNYSAFSRRWLAQHPLGVTAVIVAAAALLLYWPILNLPLSFDDLLHIRIVQEMDYLSVWQPTRASAFYRPLMFLPVLLTRSLFGYFPPAFVYSLNLLLHALNSVLLAWLTWRLWSRWQRALVAGLLFASYPFAFQAVAVFGNNVYPQLVALILLALHSYLSALNEGRGWWVVTAVLFILGLLSHELVVLFGGFAALVQWTWQRHLPLRRDAFSPFNLRSVIVQNPYLPFLLAGALYSLIHPFLPTNSVPFAITIGDLWLKFLYLLQAAAYPLLWFTNRLPGLSAATLVLGGSAVMLGVTWWAARRRGNRLALLLGWGWWGLTAVLLLLTVSADYLLHGPRLIYLSSVGISLLWAIFLDELWVWQNGRLIWCLLVAAICLTGSWFVRRQVMALANLGSTVDLFTEVMTERPLDEGVLLINPPAWRSPVHNTFPAGSEHVALMGEHLFIEELVWDNLRQMRPVLAFTVPSLLSDPGYPYDVHEQTAAALITTEWSPAGFHIFLHDYTPEGIHPHYAGFVYSPNEMAPVIATFGNYTLRAASVELCQRQVSTQFTWQPPTNPAATTSMFVQLLDADGRLIAQSDGPPFTLPPDLLDLPSNWQLTERRTIYLPEDAPQPTQLLLGIYDYVSGQRATARDSQQTTLPDNALTLPVTYCKL